MRREIVKVRGRLGRQLLIIIIPLPDADQRARRAHHPAGFGALARGVPSASLLLEWHCAAPCTMPFEMALCPARQLCTLQGWRLQRVNPNSRACLAGRARRTYTPRTVSPGAEHPFLRRSDWQARERDYFITEYQCTHKCGPLPREGFRAAQGLGSRQRRAPLPCMCVVP